MSAVQPLLTLPALGVREQDSEGWDDCRFLTCSVLPVRVACNLTCPFCYRDLQSRSLWRYDTLLDVAGGRPVFASRRVLAPRGTLVLIGGPAGRWLQPAGHMFSALAMASPGQSKSP